MFQSVGSFFCEQNQMFKSLCNKEDQRPYIDSINWSVLPLLPQTFSEMDPSQKCLVAAILFPVISKFCIISLYFHIS